MDYGFGTRIQKMANNLIQIRHWNGSKSENEQLDSLADEEISSEKITEDSSDSNNASGIDETETEESGHLLQIEELKNQIKTS